MMSKTGLTVMKCCTQTAPEEDDDDDPLPPRPSFTTVRGGIEAALEFCEHPNSNAELQSYAQTLKVIREAIIRMHSKWPLWQTRLDSFFKSTTPLPHPSATLASRPSSEDSTDSP
ncbi:hypothetical protein E2C01_057766 [Portunus trituberculatus]|uniref:Uncharacterized protein n=1 Tax=Portunus trituberculatus TaxID=210409 RepID=A0A5B7H210_PORTR|nr:hypothetical protein [Portunus trituberculatus]